MRLHLDVPESGSVSFFVLLSAKTPATQLHSCNASWAPQSLCLSGKSECFTYPREFPGPSSPAEELSVLPPLTDASALGRQRAKRLQPVPRTAPPAHCLGDICTAGSDFSVYMRYFYIRLWMLGKAEWKCSSQLQQKDCARCNAKLLTVLQKSTQEFAQLRN